MNHNKMMALICTFAKEIFWDSSDDEENDGKSAKVENYSEDIVPAMTNRQFKLHFRLSPETFEDMLRKLSTVHGKNITPGHPEIPLDKAAMIMVWYLANLESFRSVANRFGISKSTCSSVLYRMCMLLLKINTKFNIISWPSQNRAQFIASSFEKPHKLPGVIGAIDGSHIRINAPKENHNCYINRKSYHSVLLQGVCDHNKLFIDVFCGLPGSVHDSTLFKRSDLYKRIESNNITFPNNTHLIGDLAYTLSPYLLVGFKDYGNLTRRQRNFNLILNKSRSVIENAFALLKGRFRRLKFLETVRLDFISLIIVAACILHNICILSGEIVDDLIDINQEIQEERTNASLDQPFNNEHENNIAIRKRTDIMNALPIIIRNGDVV